MRDKTEKQAKPKTLREAHSDFAGTQIAGEGPCFECTRYTRCAIHGTVKNVLKEVGHG